MTYIPIIIAFLLVVKLLMTAGATILSWRISRMSVTPTAIWYLWTGAFLLITSRAVIKMFAVASYTKEAEVFGLQSVFVELIFWNVIYFLMFAAVLKTYFDLKSKFKGLD